MRFDDRLLDEIKARIPPSRLIGRTVALQRAGASLKALSPFAKEKTPSFYVHDEKRIFKDFSSGLGGDIFKWLMLTEGLSFHEAVEKLAAEAGVALPERDADAAARDQRRRHLVDWLEAAHAFFAESLRAGAGREARDYLIRRGVPEPDWGRFEIGYAPDGWDSLRKHLTRKGASPQDLVAAGLLRESSRGEAPYDAFRHRVTFAIRDPSGKLVGFGARALAKDEKAKYINSPESEVFKKGELLYRFPEARRAAQATGRDAAKRGVVIVEGYMDAIALAQAGIGEAAATLGTALTPEQIDLAWRAGPRPTLLLDGDAPGIAAGFRAAERVLAKLEPGRTFRFARLQGVKDPDDLVRAEGLDGARRVLDAAVSLDAVVWEKLVHEHPVASPDDAAALEEALKGEVARIAHAGVRAHYRAALLERFSEAYGYGARRRGRGRPGRPLRDRTARRPPPLASDFDDSLAHTRAHLPAARELARLLSALLDHPEILEHVAEPLAVMEIGDDGLGALRDALVAAAEREEVIDKVKLERHLAGLGVEQVAARLRERSVSCAPVVRPELGEREAVEAWLREAERYLSQLNGPVERRGLKSAALAVGDHESLRRFTAAAIRAGGPDVASDARSGAESGDAAGDAGGGDARRRFDAAMQSLEAARDHKLRKRRP